MLAVKRHHVHSGRCSISQFLPCRPPVNEEMNPYGVAELAISPAWTGKSKGLNWVSNWTEQRFGPRERTRDGRLKGRLEHAGEKSLKIWQWAKNNFFPRGGRRRTPKVMVFDLVRH